MTMEPSSARLRLRVLGAFSSTPTGRHFELSPATFAGVLTAAALSASVEVEDRLAAGVRRFALSFDGLRAFQLGGVIATQPLLAALRSLADALGGKDGAAAPSGDALLARLRELVGEGTLTAQIEAAIAAASAPPTASAKPSPAAGAVDAVVRTMRAQPSPSSTTGAKEARVARAARKAIEEAVFATAADLLRDPAVTRLESAWRGLRLLVDQCTAAAAIAIEVIDVAADGVEAALTRELSPVAPDAIERPDVYIVVDPCEDLARLTRLADRAEEMNAPVIVALPAGDPPAGFAELQKDERSRWLCAVTNRVVVAAEGQGAARRVVLASPALALGAMLAASFRETRSFARILGGAGALAAPASHDLTGRDGSISTLPTEAFFSIETQTTLASQGIVGIGSRRNTSQLMLSAAPMVRAAKDALPLPAQILSGRIVRFATWVRDQVPADASDAEAAGFFEQAAPVFLFAGMTEGALLRAAVGAVEGRRVVEIAAGARAEHAAIPFQLAFTLPLAG